MDHPLRARPVLAKFFLVTALSLLAAFLSSGRASAAGACVVNPKFLQVQSIYQRLPANQIDPQLASTWNGLVARQHELMNQACQQIDPLCDRANSLTTAYNSVCHGEVPHDVYQSCLNQQGAVQAAINQCNSAADPYDAAVDSWVADLGSFVSSLRAAVQENCKRRSALVSNWSELKGRIGIDRQVMSNVNASFKQHVASFEATGDTLEQIDKDLERIDDALDHVESHIIAIDLIEHVSEESVQEFKLIAKGINAWISDIVRLVATVQLNRATDATTQELSELQSRTNKLTADANALQQLKQQFAQIGPCDSTIFTGQ